MQKKYQIFVSSTFRDLGDERQDAIRNILDLGHIPAGMELFPAADTEQLSYIKKVIDECDYYLLIVGGRYGSLDVDGFSFTEKEYDYAVQTGKVVIAFVHGNTSAIPLGKSDTAPGLVEALNAFKEKVMAGRLVKEWTTRESLEPLVLKALVYAMSEYPAVGWIRANAAASEDLLSQVNNLRLENDRLKGELLAAEAAIRPILPDLADLDEEISLSFTYSRPSGSGSSQRNESFNFQWKEIFAAIGPDLMAPRMPSSISVSLTSYLKEKRGRSYNYILQHHDREMVKLHFIALGFLRSYTAQALNAGVTEFLSLTDLGKAKLTELIAVRAKSRESADV